VKKTILLTTVAAMTLGSVLLVHSQSTAPQARRGTAERGLIGIALYDPGTKVISSYGSPDQIQALTVGGGAAAGGGGGGGGGGAGAPATGPGGGGGRGGGGGGPQGAATDQNRDTLPQELMVGDPFGPGGEWRDLNQAAPGSPDAPRPSSFGPPAGQGGPGGGAPGRGGNDGAAGGGQSTRVTFTRWIYNTKKARYAFVLDKFNRVIQIEAVGLENRSVKTRRGITFGSSFGSVIKAYNAPDGYEINGDNLVVRFLVRDRVAFRLSKLKADKPHQVTGVVVAAGKT